MEAVTEGQEVCYLLREPTLTYYYSSMCGVTRSVFSFSICINTEMAAANDRQSGLNGCTFVGTPK